MALKVEAKGVTGGNAWDDGLNHHDVTKIHVRGGLEGIQFIKFEYVKDGKITVGPTHGIPDRGFTQTFELNHLEKEYLISVEGYYNKLTGVIQSFKFKTNKRTSGLIGFNKGTKFSLEARGKRIVGFHGSAEKNLISLGAYFIKSPSIKSGIQGGQTSGKSYDDGGDYDSIRKVYVTFDGSAIRHIKFDYEKADQMETRERGVKDGTQYEFMVNHPYEYITSVEGSYDVIQPYNCIVLTSLTFKTSKQRTSPTIGKVVGTKFVLECKGNGISGFHGRVGFCVEGIGAYYSPFPPCPCHSENLQGNERGVFVDDHLFENAKKVCVGQDDVGIASLKFEYANGTRTWMEGNGNKTLISYSEFELDYPSEYITSIEGCHDKGDGAETGVITMLRINTNKRTSPQFGHESACSFVLKKEGNRMTGLYGKFSSWIQQIGVE
ncbi:unnamed protein product [Brassica napus]|uniref:(rape) hypothetical protein n=1 Tax=Brassica napus TaxID=3708 RepID=A0A816ZIB5_BRANA|nr:unnamed protein product [Brassica napus]